MATTTTKTKSILAAIDHRYDMAIDACEGDTAKLTKIMKIWDMTEIDFAVIFAWTQCSEAQLTATLDLWQRSAGIDIVLPISRKAERKTS